MSEQQKMDSERAAFEAWVIPAWSLEKRTDSDGDTVYVEDWVQGAWIGWQKARSLPVGVPDALREAVEYLDDNPFNEIGAGSILHRAMRDALAAAPTVKAEQVQCDTCHGQGEICVGQQTFGYMSMQPPEPIMEVCPECGGEEAPSLPAAGSSELIADAERCLFVMREIGSMDADDITGDDVDLRFEDDEGRDTGCDVSIVDYAEKSADVIEKMIAAISAQQSAPERVSVPVELLERAVGNGLGSSIKAIGELRALLASHQRGEA